VTGSIIGVVCRTFRSLRRSAGAIVLNVSLLPLSWLLMMAMHELGHVLAALASGGVVAKVVLHPLTISRTELAENPHPVLVAWGGPVAGVLLPLALWALVQMTKLPWPYLYRFFAGFCLIANGAYIAGGSFLGIGDAHEMLKHGAPIWSLWAYGLTAIPLGLLLWHRLGSHFGLGPAGRNVDRGAIYAFSLSGPIHFATA
jgi:hypothetical protein